MNERHNPKVTKLPGLLRDWRVFRHPFGAMVLTGTVWPQGEAFTAELWALSAAGPGGEDWHARQFAFTDKGRVKVDFTTFQAWTL